LTHYTFNSNAEGFTGTDFAWNGAEGSPLLGCLARTTTFTNASVASPAVSIPVTAGDPISFRFRMDGTASGFNTVAMSVKQGGVPLGLIDIPNGDDIPFVDGGTSSGWLLRAGTVHTSGTVDLVGVVFGNGSPNGISAAYVDSIFVAETQVDVAETRYLGMAADSGKLYLTSIEENTLVVESLALTGFASANVATFGTAAYADPDTFTRGIFPVVRPGFDSQVYLYGRDGSNKQVYFNDLNGTLGWVDVGAGTAVWGTAKYCVALLPWPTLPGDVVAAFSDNDVYRTQFSTANWVKMGDAASNLRTAARLDTEGHKLLAAGTAAGTLYFTQNYGVSFGSGTAAGTAAGTINAIEFSL
jgi:hypothetical protein